MKRVAIIQSNYIPWKGYFDIINLVDEFVLFDDVQYTRRDWRNRNLIKTLDELKWISIPVEVKDKYFQTISEVKVVDSKWTQRHWRNIHNNYTKSPFFSLYCDRFYEAYTYASRLSFLSEINFIFIQLINDILGIGTEVNRSDKYICKGDRNEKLVSICKQCGADSYLSGPSARNYLDEEKFTAVGIQVEWIDYSGYPEYPQLGNQFHHNVSIIDLLFNTGPDAPSYMLSF
jgi:hypothetical protein